MRARSFLAVAAVAALVAAPAAGAATKKPAPKKPPVKTYCNLIVDKSGDGKWLVFNEKNLDVQSLDIATGAKTMVAVMRLGDTSYSLNSDPLSTTVYEGWSMGVTSNYGQSYMFYASTDSTGKVSASASVDNSGVALKSFAVDTTHHTFTWTLDRSVDKTLTRKNTVFRSFRGGSSANGDSADTAPDTATPITIVYPDKAPSCVHAS